MMKENKTKEQPIMNWLGGWNSGTQWECWAAACFCYCKSHESFCLSPIIPNVWRKSKSRSVKCKNQTHIVAMSHMQKGCSWSFHLSHGQEIPRQGQHLSKRVFTPTVVIANVAPVQSFLDRLFSTVSGKNVSQSLFLVPFYFIWNYSSARLHFI